MGKLSGCKHDFGQLLAASQSKFFLQRSQIQFFMPAFEKHLPSSSTPGFASRTFVLLVLFNNSKHGGSVGDRRGPRKRKRKWHSSLPVWVLAQAYTTVASLPGKSGTDCGCRGLGGAFSRNCGH